MADAYKVLYQGQLPLSVGTLVTVGGAVSWIVKNITVVNNDTSARTFALYRDGTAASNIITPPAVSVPAGGMCEWDGTMTFAASSTIRGLASAASQVTITISGDEIS